MLKRSLIIVSMILLPATLSMAQNTNSAQQNTNRSTRKRTVEPSETPATSSTPRRTQGKGAPAGAERGPFSGVYAAFNALLEGVRHRDVEAVANAYWDSPRLILFNNNGTVTKGWQQMKENRASSYPDVKDVKLEVRDLHVTPLGPNAALITCLWSQSQTFRGTPESATGRMTIVFRRVGKEWKAIHLHTSPDAPNPARLMPSEQTPAASPKPTP